MTKKIHQGIYKEKGSIFFCNIQSLNDKKELDDLKEQTLLFHKKIKHLIVVARFIDKEQNNIVIASNDREPIKVANEILNVLEKNNISNIGICIARHFGGTLLGANNLGRAYFKAFQEAYQLYINDLNNN